MSLTIRLQSEYLPLMLIKNVLAKFRAEYTDCDNSGGWVKGSKTIPTDVQPLDILAEQLLDVPLGDYITGEVCDPRKRFTYWDIVTWGDGSFIQPVLQYFDGTVWRDGHDPTDFDTGVDFTDLVVRNKPDEFGTVQVNIPRSIAKRIESKYRLKVTITQHSE